VAKKKEHAMSSAMDKAYNPNDFEDRLYDFWMENNLFAPAGDQSQDPFVIVIPPPNVTGVLHMGHGLNNILQDTLIRYYRMKGRPTLWVPGTDHAGIATQSVMEKRLAKEGKTRQDLGREEFVRRTWELKEEHHTIITKQLKKLGASVDWSRERFTMDEGLSKAVKEVFVKLHEKGLVYKSHYLVNWDPGAQTAVSDDEVDYKEINGALYKIQYPLVEGAGYVTVETTRPETMLGDTAVAVHPEDERFSELIGQKVKLPLTDREIPIITDSYVDREFGTGAVKITPGHDPNDYEMGKRHGLEMINILNPDATLNENVPVKYQGMHVKKARKAVVEDLEEQGFFLGQTPHKHQVGHCYRSGEVIEPYLSEQWFVKMKPLAEKALEAWKDGQIQFYPKKWENTYSNWLEGIRTGASAGSFGGAIRSRLGTIMRVIPTLAAVKKKSGRSTAWGIKP
jgi:valyl-tRNA synthetase